MPNGTFRIAIVGASTLRGKELNEALNDSALAASEFVLLDEEEALGKLEAIGEEVTVVQPIEENSFRNIDFTFFAGERESTRKHWHQAQRAGSSIIDLTAALEGERGVLVRAPWLNDALNSLDASRAAADGEGSPDLETTAVVPAHPAALALGLLLARLSGVAKVTAAWATVLEPASEHGRAGMDELHHQTVNLLSFQPLPTEVFGTQVAFNLVSSLGEEARTRLHATEERIRAHYDALGKGRLPQLNLQLAQAPVFHGHIFSIGVELADDLNLEQIERGLAGEHVDVMIGETTLPTNLTAAGQPDIIVRVRPEPPQPDPLSNQKTRRVWLWAATDNLKIAAENAVACAGELSRFRPHGKVQ